MRNWNSCINYCSKNIKDTQGSDSSLFNANSIPYDKDNVLPPCNLPEWEAIPNVRVDIAGNPILENFTYVRRDFTGDALQCCINDMECRKDGTDTDPKCYSDIDRKKTCDLVHRDITSAQCQNILDDWYTKDEGNISWLYKWITKDGKVVPFSADYALKRGIYRTCSIPEDPPIEIGCVAYTKQITPLGIDYGKRIIGLVIDRYIQDGYVLGSNYTDQGYHVFQEYLYSLFCKIPSIAQEALSRVCRSASESKYFYYPQLRRWCGCFMIESQYDEYIKSGISKQCTPFCNKIDTLQNTDDNGNIMTCPIEEPCIIDEKNISLINSLPYRQTICGRCSLTSSCKCDIKFSSLEEANGKLKNGVKLESVCAKTVCRDAEGNEISCDGKNSKVESFKEDKSSTDYFMWILLAITLFIIVMIGITY